MTFVSAPSVTASLFRLGGTVMFSPQSIALSLLVAQVSDAASASAATATTTVTAKTTATPIGSSDSPARKPRSVDPSSRRSKNEPVRNSSRNTNNHDQAETVASNSVRPEARRRKQPTKPSDASNKQIVPPPPPSTTTSVTSISNNVVAKTYQQFFSLPQSFRYLLAGTLGNAGFYVLEKRIYQTMLVMPPGTLPFFCVRYMETVSFSLAYLIQIVPQHLLNAMFCYGFETINTSRKYWRTLMGTYSALCFTLLLSTVVNVLLIQKFGMQKDLAFGGTLFAGAVLNYILLTYLVNDGKDAAEDDIPDALKTDAKVQ